MPGYLTWIGLAVGATLIVLALTTSLWSALLYVAGGVALAIFAAVAWAWLVFRGRPGAGS